MNIFCSSVIIKLFLNKIFTVIKGKLSYTVYMSDPPSRIHFGETALLMTYLDIIPAVPPGLQAHCQVRNLPDFRGPAWPI